jgi:hypothetical protein
MTAHASSEVAGLVDEDPLIANTDPLAFSVSHGPGYRVVSVVGQLCVVRQAAQLMGQRP